MAKNKRCYANTENIYFRNVNNNAGIFDYLIATAEDQETKEAALAYHFIRKVEVAPTATEVTSRVETWLAKNFAVNVDFKIADALETLNRLGLVRREASSSLSRRSSRQSSNCTRFGTIFLSASREMSATLTLKRQVLKAAGDFHSERLRGPSRPT